MFSFALNDILFHLKPARPQSIVGESALMNMDAQLASSFQRAAEKALSCAIPELKASDWILSGKKYASGRRERRELLLALTLGEVIGGGGRYIMRVIDLAWAITEETTWLDTSDIACAAAPEEDEAAFETAALLSWVWHLLGKEIASVSREVLARIEDSISARVLEPFTASEIPAWAQVKGERTFSKLLALTACFLLADTDDRRRWAGLRRCFNMMDNLIAALPNDGVHPMGVERWLRDAQALTDAASLITMATDGIVDFKADKKYLRLMDYPVSAHMGGGYFANPDGQPKPDIDGRTVFKIGEYTGNASLKKLGAYLGERQAYSGGSSSTDKILTALIHKRFLAEPARCPLRKRVSLPIGMLISAAASGFQATLSGGSRIVGHSDAGSLYLTHNGAPVLFDLGTSAPFAEFHSVPCVNGFSINKGFGGVKDLEARFEEAFTYLLVNLAPAYPREAGVISWQRTVMLSPHEKSVRLIEAYELANPAESIVFRFITPTRPERTGDSAYRIGGVRLYWEEALEHKMDMAADGYRIEVTAKNAGRRGNFAFVFSEDR